MLKASFSDCLEINVSDIEVICSLFVNAFVRMSLSIVKLIVLEWMI